MPQGFSTSELSRLQKMAFREEQLKSQGFLLIAGVDEAGRGPLAGPVVAAACLFEEMVFLENLNDSKKLSEEKREKLYQQIAAHSKIHYGLGICDVLMIDRVNILQATWLAMQRAIANLPISPDYLLIDGNRLPSLVVPAEAMVAGDRKSMSIAAASIVAKVTRDQIMRELDIKWPQYGFARNKGYGTEEHLEAIRKFGPCEIHRRSFEPIKSLVKETTESLFN